MAEAHIYIYGEIEANQSPQAEEYGFVNLRNVKSQYDAQDPKAETVVVHIHSVGGVVFEGFAIHDYLRSLGKKIETRVEGLCASIATVIALAGDRRLMTSNSDYFIHNPWGLAMGDREQMQKYTDDLARLEDKLAKFYASKTKLTEEEALAFMKGETTFSAEEALAKGFTTETAPALKAVAKFDPSKDFAKNETSQKNINPKPAKMNKKATKTGDQKKAKTLAEKILALITSSKEEVKAKILQDANGEDIDFVDLEEDATPAVGDRAEIDGAPAEGERVMPSGETFVFTAGELTEIKPAEEEEEESEDLAAANAEIERLTAELEAANAKASKAEADLAKAQKTIQKNAKTLETIQADVTALKAEIGSEFETPAPSASKHKKAQDGEPTARPQLFKTKS